MVKSGASPRIPGSSNSSKTVHVAAQRSEDVTACQRHESASKHCPRNVRYYSSCTRQPSYVRILSR